MDRDTVLLFTRAGLGHAPQELQETLVRKFLGLLLEGGQLPAKLLFYTDGVRLACEGSPVLDLLMKLEAGGVERFDEHPLRAAHADGGELTFANPVVDRATRDVEQ